ncbi:3'-phosphoesterase [Candidatus Bathyarchaeota archaeon]|nr:3'-phosphoesterase [Candidatus Bathyarchaeota archaeon]
MSLQDYKNKRNFEKTLEPSHGVIKGEANKYVVHEHHASHLHWDLRLERAGVLKSWTIPKEPPQEFGVRRLAIQVEDHPIEYGDFEGVIPEGEYGAGSVKIWDKGTYETQIWTNEKIQITINGTRLNGDFDLIRFKKAGEKEWLFLKRKNVK